MAETSSFFSFFGTLILSLGSVLIFGILLAIAIYTTQNTANLIIGIASTGAAGIVSIGKSLVAQAEVLVNTNNGEILQSSQNAVLAIVNGVDTTVNTITAVGGSLLRVIIDGFQALAEVLQEVGQQVIILFLASVAPSFIRVNFQLTNVVAILTISQAILNTIISPIIKFIQTLQL